MYTLSAYLQTWRLKLSYTKTVTAAFHLNNRETKRELNIYNNNRLLPLCPTLTYLGVKLDRSLTFRHYLMALRKKTILKRDTAEATCRVRVECWFQNTEHSCLISGLLNSSVLRTSLVSQRSHLPQRQCTT